jgi:1L-myo-inositol 1-phosphate cytidylyltransferase / CDP-L-myo-inositol myo-inositolphosphotransferase
MAGVPRGPVGDPAILGLRLTQRAALAARRAGYGQVFLVGAKGPAMPAIADWRDLAAILPSSHTEPVVIAPAAILAETDWLERLASTRIEPAAWGRIPNRIVVIAAASVLGAVDELTSGGARDLAAVEGRLARLFGPPASLSADIDPMVVEAPGDVRAAEQRLLRSLVKDTDGFMARHVERPISLQISCRLAGTAITPNQMSLISIAVGICGGPFFLSSRPLMQTIGALLFLAHSILDGCDGELARLKFQQSRWGGVLDFWGDNVVHTVIFACMGIGWSLSTGSPWPLALGAGAVLGTLGSAGFVYWRLMRSKDGGDTLFTSVSDAPGRPLTRLLDSASRRDFIYLVILLALFGQSNWFLVMAGIGAPIYFLLVLFAARPQAGQAGSPVAPGANP